MSNNTKPDCISVLNIRFRATKKALKQIESRELRRDFKDLLDGVNFALAENRIELANHCISALSMMAHALCRTIGGRAAVAIIDGLEADGKSAAIKALRYPDWKSGKRCSLSGSRSCYDSPNSKCHEETAGCISTDDRFAVSAKYAWGTILLRA